MAVSCFPKLSRRARKRYKIVKYGERRSKNESEIEPERDEEREGKGTGKGREQERERGSQREKT